MRTLRTLLRDRGTALPLIVLLLQLVLLQAGAVAFATGAMGSVGDGAPLCLGLGSETDDRGGPAAPNCPYCAVLCVTHAAAGKIIPPNPSAGLVAPAIEAALIISSPATAPVLSRAPPPRPGSTRAPPF